MCLAKVLMLVLWWLIAASAHALAPPSRTRGRGPVTVMAAAAAAANDAVLPGRWRLSFRFPRENVVVAARFVDDVGYEPPRGQVVFAAADGKDVASGRWELSEDPDDKRDGLWIWGLFAEPLYPYLLLTLDSAALGLPEGGQLACKINHKSRPYDDAPLLTRGTVAMRKRETQGADLAGLSSVTYKVDSVCGTVVCQPMGNPEPSSSSSSSSSSGGGSSEEVRPEGAPGGAL